MFSKCEQSHGHKQFFSHVLKWKSSMQNFFFIGVSFCFGNNNNNNDYNSANDNNSNPLKVPQKSLYHDGRK